MNDFEDTKLLPREAPLSSRRVAILGLCFFAILVVTLPTVPYLFPGPPDVASAATAAGYSNKVAFKLALTILVCCAVVFAAVSRFGWVWPSKWPEAGDEDIWKRGAIRVPELVVVFASVGFLYLPWAFAETGPFTEDSFFLSILHRMQFGQRPYLDFEFMYGPLMFLLPHLWVKAFGYSAIAYYSYVAVVETAKFTLFAAFLQSCFDNFRARLAAFAILAPLLFNVLLGPNYDGTRQLLPASILIMIAARPHSGRVAVAAGLLMGALLAYSHEFGVACLAAIGTIYLLLAWKSGARESLVRLFVITVISIASWLIISIAILGKTFITYMEASWDLAQRYQLGEFGLPFYWTANAVALFGLLTLTGVIVGVGIGWKKDRGVLAGDLLLLGSFVYTLISLKSGLNRYDVYHLTPPIFALALAFTLPWPSRLFPVENARRFGLALTYAISITYFAGLPPVSTYVFENWLHGLKRLAVGGGATDQVAIESATPMIRNRIPPEAASLRDYLLSAGSNRPVVYYSRMFVIDKIIGVPNASYTTTRNLTSEAAGLKIADFLSRNRNALVVIDRGTYSRVFRMTDIEKGQEPTDFYKPTMAKSIVTWSPIVHQLLIESEIIIQDLRWDRTVGSYLRANQAPTLILANWVVLADKTRMP